MVKQGVTVKDVAAQTFIKEYAAHLKQSGKIELPKWHNIVKTGKFKELSPYDPDWYFVRAASIARRIYLRQDIGVGALRKVYGGAECTGVRQPRFCKASGGLIRKILQDLEELDIVTKEHGGKGRRITDNGRRTLDGIACKVVYGK